MVVDAGGTTASTGIRVWFVKFGPKHVTWVWGENGKFDMSQPRIESIIDPNDSTKKFDGYVSTMLAYPGVQVGSVQSVVRIKKLTADSGKGLTDALLNRGWKNSRRAWGPNADLHDACGQPPAATATTRPARRRRSQRASSAWMARDHPDQRHRGDQQHEAII
jgi:hypothetical protein